MTLPHRNDKCVNRIFTSVLTAFIFFSISCFDLNAQVNYGKEFRHLSCSEKRWVILHPFIAKKTFRLSIRAREAANEMLNDSLLDQDVSGGQNDAWRHTFWMALLSQHICWRKARGLGKAHEKGNYREFKKRKAEEGVLPDSVSRAMDLFNNEIGIAIGRANEKLPEEDLKKAVRDSVLAGKAKVVLKNEKGEVLNCDGYVIDEKKYFHVWNIPKCLVNSDYRKK